MHEYTKWVFRRVRFNGKHEGVMQGYATYYPLVYILLDGDTQISAFVIGSPEQMELLETET